MCKPKRLYAHDSLSVTGLPSCPIVFVPNTFSRNCSTSTDSANTGNQWGRNQWGQTRLIFRPEVRYLDFGHFNLLYDTLCIRQEIPEYRPPPEKASGTSGDR